MNKENPVQYESKMRVVEIVQELICTGKYITERSALYHLWKTARKKNQFLPFKNSHEFEPFYRNYRRYKSDNCKKNEKIPPNTYKKKDKNLTLTHKPKNCNSQKYNEIDYVPISRLEKKRLLYIGDDLNIFDPNNDRIKKEEKVNEQKLRKELQKYGLQLPKQRRTSE